MDKLLIIGALLVVPALQIGLEDNNYDNYEGLRDDDDRVDVYGDKFNNDQGLIHEKFEENEFGDNDYIMGSSMAARVGEDEYGNYNGNKQGSSQVAAPHFPSGTSIYEGSGDNELGDNDNDDLSEVQEDGYRSYYRNGQGSSQVALPHFPKDVLPSAEVEDDGYRNDDGIGQGSSQFADPHFPSAEIEDDEYGNDYGNDYGKPSLLDIGNKAGSPIRCSQTCISGAQRKCANTAKNTCRKKCGGGRRKTGGCNNAWGTLPSNTFSNWINQIEMLKITRGYELSGISECDRTTPNEMVVFINSIIAKQKQKITTTVRENLMNIFGQIDQCCKPNNGWTKPAGVQWVIEENWPGIGGGGGGHQTGGCNNAWGTLPSNTFSNWINQIEMMKITRGYEWSGISECDRTTPNEMVVFINSIISKQKRKITTTVRENLMDIFGQIDQCCKPNNGWTRPQGVQWVIEENLTGFGGVDLGQYGADDCQMQDSGMSVVPTIIYTQWMNELRPLDIFSKRELCECQNYARSNPDELIAFINTCWQKKSSQVNLNMRQTLKSIISNIGLYSSERTGLISVTPINIKMITWKQDITRIGKETKIKQNILERLTTIINSAGTVANCIPMITEITRICTQDRIPRKTKTQLEIVMMDMKRAALKQKISYLLTTYDRLIKDDIKLKLSQICHTQDVYDYSQMVQQFDKTVEYIKTLVQGNLLPAQCRSELKIICTKLGVGGFQTGGQVDVVLPPRIAKFITISELIAMLSSSSSASFEVGSIQDCLRVCVKSVLESCCPYGYGKCSTQASQIGRKVTCTVKVNQCQKTSSVPQLSTEEVIRILKRKNRAECITFSSAACNKICKQFVRSKDFMFGGIQCKFNWDGNSKICSIQTTGQKALTPWLNDQCGQGCRYADLSYLDLDQVGGLAHKGSGCRFKTPDQQTCKQYCLEDVDIPSSCPGSFTCNSGCKCWPGSCICTIKHTCQQDRNKYFRSAKNKVVNAIVEENIEVPRVLPVVSEGKTVIKNEN